MLIECKYRVRRSETEKYELCNRRWRMRVFELSFVPLFVNAQSAHVQRFTMSYRLVHSVIIQYHHQESCIFLIISGVIISFASALTIPSNGCQVILSLAAKRRCLSCLRIHWENSLFDGCEANSKDRSIFILPQAFNLKTFDLSEFFKRHALPISKLRHFWSRSRIAKIYKIEGLKSARVSDFCLLLTNKDKSMRFIIRNLLWIKSTLVSYRDYECVKLSWGTMKTF